MVIMASEVGVLDIPPERIRYKGRLKPGRMFLVNFEEGRIVDDVELKNAIASRYPYRQWLNEQRITLEDLPAPASVPGLDEQTLSDRMRMFGYTLEHVNVLLMPMAVDSKEPLGSMGNDAPLAVLSERPRLIYDYFKQLFAQVTNPPIDSIREDIIMSISSYIGPEQNLLDHSPEHCHRLQIHHPILRNRELAQLKEMDHRGWRSKVVDITYPIHASAPAGRRRRASSLPRSGERGGGGRDRRGVQPGRSLRSGGRCGPYSRFRTPCHRRCTTTWCGKAKRTQIGIIVETAEPREVHHFCTLVGYGADAINPYLAYEAMWYLYKGEIPRAVREGGSSCSTIRRRSATVCEK